MIPYKLLKLNSSIIILFSSVLCACGGGSRGDASSDPDQIPPDAVVSTPALAPTPVEINAKPVASQVAIVGSSEVGGTLALNSIFEDSDGDSEGDSIVAWTTPTVELQRGTEKSFIIPQGTEGETIHAWIHPVDEHGVEGDGVRSENAITVQGSSVDQTPDDGFTVTNSITSPYEDLLQHRSGFAKDIMGGAGGDVVTITSLDSFGYAALRDALESPDPKWIRFSPGLTGTMSLSTAENIRVGPNKTIDGRGADVTMVKPTQSNNDRFVMFEYFNDSGDFIIHNITFDDVGSIQSDHGSHRPGVSAGSIVYGDFGTSARFWFDHLTISRVYDDPFYIVNSPYVTYSFINGDNQAKQFIGKNSSVTFHHNIWDGDNFIASQWSGYDPSYQSDPLGGSRIPYAQDGAKLHVYNNYINSWWSSGIQSAGQDSQVYAHRNVYGQPTIASRAPMLVNAKNGVLGSIYQFDNVRANPPVVGTPWIQDVSAGYAEAQSAQTDPANVFVPAYDFTAESVGTSFISSEAQALIIKLQNQAGSQGVNAPKW